MKHLFIFYLTFCSLTSAFGQALVNRSGADTTQVDERLKVGKSFYVPSGPVTGLNGGLEIPGALFYNTTDSTLYIFKGNIGWRPVQNVVVPAFDSTSVHRAGDEVVSGKKTFSSPLNIANNVQLARNDTVVFQSKGVSNLGVGVNALNINVTGTSNVMVGYRSGSALTSGLGNAALGGNALRYITSGVYNTGVGSNAHSGITSGQYNVGIGAYAGYFLDTAKYNTSIGSGAGYRQRGNYNTFIGSFSAGSNNNSYGDGNVFIGYASGFYTAVKAKNKFQLF